MNRATHVVPAFASSSTLPSLRAGALTASHNKLSRPLCATSPHRAGPRMAVYPARTAAITGASGGIGLETSKKLCAQLPTLQHLLLCVRDTERGEAVAARLRDARDDLRVSVVPVDLSRADSVLRCADAVGAALGDDALDLLVCNAGIMVPPLSFVGGPGVPPTESQYFVNHLAHATLVRRLAPALRAGEHGRVLFVSSTATYMSMSRKSAPMAAEKRSSALDDASYQRWKAYSESKVAMSMFAKVFAEREQGKIESVSLHPGVVQTELGRFLLPPWMVSNAPAPEEPGLFRKALSRVLNFKLPSEGAELSAELGTAESGSFENGMMYVKVGGEKADKRLFPLLFNDDECNKLYDDTVAFLDEMRA